MIYLIITASTLLGIFIHCCFIKRVKIAFTTGHITVEIPLLWTLSFTLFFLYKRVVAEQWAVNNYSISLLLFFTAVSVALGIVAILVHLYLIQLKSKKTLIFSLFTVKGIRFFPLTAFFYYLLGTLIIITGLIITESYISNLPTTQLSIEWYSENIVISNMNNNKTDLHYPYDDTKYPLIKIKGTSINSNADVKILVIGDSFVFGQGSSNLNYCWWNQLSNDLNRKGYNCTVYAVARPGASTYTQLQWLKTTSMLTDLDPDIVIFGYVTNDPEFDTYETGIYQIDYYGQFRQFDLPLKDTFSRLLPNIFQKFDYKLTEKLGPTELFSDKIGLYYPTWELKVVDKEHLSQYNSYAVLPLGDYAASTGIPFIMVTTPQRPDIEYFELRYSPVIPLFEKANIKLYNSLYAYCTELTKEKHAGIYAINPAEDHPGTAANWFYASYVADLLERDYPAILGEKTLTGKEVYDIEVNDWMPYELDLDVRKQSSFLSEYTIQYPKAEQQDYFLNMPIKQNYVKLNFRYPVDFSEVTIQGDALDSAELYVTAIDETLGYDNQNMYDLGQRNDGTFKWEDPSARRITSLCIHADMANGNSGKLTVTVRAVEGGIHP